MTEYCGEAEQMGTAVQSKAMKRYVCYMKSSGSTNCKSFSLSFLPFYIFKYGLCMSSPQRIVFKAQILLKPDNYVIYRHQIKEPSLVGRVRGKWSHKGEEGTGTRKRARLEVEIRQRNWQEESLGEIIGSRSPSKWTPMIFGPGRSIDGVWSI